MADTEKLVFQTEDGKEVEFEVIESTRVNGADYILVTTDDTSVWIHLHRSRMKHYMSSWTMRKNLMLYSRFLSSF